ncbi:MAG: hypothetical protein KBC46_02945 [Ferrovibrio sp.]|nr:hypothetical protein [Ferrovibrio sp.]
MLNAQHHARVPPALSAALDVGERLLWWGMPKQGFVLRRSDAKLIPFSLFFLGFAVFWEWQVLRASEPVFALFGIPLILAGLYITAGRFVHDAIRRRNIVYGVTDQRVLIVTPRNLKSIELSALTEIHLEKTASHVGSIVFGPELQPVAFGPGVGAWAGRPAAPAFEFIPEAEKVLNTVRAAKAAAS